MRRVTGLIGPLGFVALVAACSGEESPGNGGAAAGKSGAGGSETAGTNALPENRSGAPSGGANSLPADGGAAGAPEPPALPGELVTELCEDYWYLTVLDDENVFYSCFESMTVDYTLTEQFTLRKVVPGGEPELIATSTQPLLLLAMDDVAYYVRESGDFDATGNTWDGNIRRLAIGTTELKPFVDAVNVNWAPSILQQTDEVMIVAQHSEGSGNNTFATVEVHAKPGGEGKLIADRLPGFAAEAWLEGGSVGWVQRGPDGPFVYRAALTGAELATKGEALPNLCAGFVRDGDGFFAVCGDTNDFVRIDAVGAITKLAEGVAGVSDLVKSDRIYWSDYELNKGYSLFALNDAGHLASLTLPASLSAHTLTEEFVYMEASRADGSSIRRLALSEIE